jgi:integrase
VERTFARLATVLGVHTTSARPTLHGLRHTFAVETLVAWQRSGDDVGARMASLSTYLGHADPAGTYWYLSATPALMGLAAERLEGRFGGRP